MGLLGKSGFGSAFREVRLLHGFETKTIIPLALPRVMTRQWHSVLRVYCTHIIYVLLVLSVGMSKNIPMHLMKY